MTAITVAPADPRDAPAILALQREAYQSEARLYNDWHIPPLSQTLASLQAEFDTALILKATQDAALVGSVRAHQQDGIAHIGRLIVAPALQRQGIGGALLQAIEQAFPAARQFQLFTGSLSTGNIRLYQRHGYAITGEQVLSPRVTLVHLAKAHARGRPDAGLNGTTPMLQSPVADTRTLELTAEHAPVLQRFFEENPAYFLATSGEPAGPGEALEEITGQLPADVPFTRKWVVGYLDPGGALFAMVNLITDLLAPSVFHIGTFIVATARHGTGLAQRLNLGVEDWALAQGAAWMRLGVVQGNTRAERFWRGVGYLPVRERPGIEMGRRLVTVQNMVKPLRGQALADYYRLVPRDRPDDAAPARPQP